MRGMKAGAKALRANAKKLNNGGAHWAKGAFRRVTGSGETKEVSWCYVGGLHNVLFGKEMEMDITRFKRPAYVAAIRASALVIGGMQYRSALRKYEKAQTDEKYRARLLKFQFSYAETIVPGQPRVRIYLTLDEWFTQACESVIFQFNDASSRKWAQVEAKMIEAADGLEAQAA